MAHNLSRDDEGEGVENPRSFHDVENPSRSTKQDRDANIFRITVIKNRSPLTFTINMFDHEYYFDHEYV